MAWVAPRTWVDGEVVTASMLNGVRDSLNETAQHDHSGGSGSGTRALGGTAGLTVINFADAAAPAAPTGTLTRLFTTGSTVGVISSGGTARILSDHLHEHTSVVSQSLLIHNVTPAGPSPFTPISDLLILDAAQTGTVTQTATFGGSGKRFAVISGGALFRHDNLSLNPAITVRLFRDGTGLGSASVNIGTSGAGPKAVVALASEVVSSGSKTYTMTVAWGEASASGTVGVYGRWLNIRELSVA